MKTKTLFKSKTAALAFVTALAGAASHFVPAVGEWVTANASIILSVLGVVALGLRLVTKDKIVLFPAAPAE